MKKLTEVHIHLVYVGSGQFQFTVTNKSDPRNQIIEIVSFSGLKKSIRSMKPGTRVIKIGKASIEANASLEDVRAYCEQVYNSHERALAKGIDVDKDLDEMRLRSDPSDGSGSFLEN